MLALNKNQRIIAKHGRDSTHNFILGIPGESVKIEVPVGITVFTDDGKKIGKDLAIFLYYHLFKLYSR